MSNLLKACGLILFSFLLVQNGYAQIPPPIPPSVPETSAGVYPSLWTMNCDMVECPMYGNGLLKAIVWDGGNPGTKLFIEFNGTAVGTFNIPNGYWPDVVIGDNTINIGNVYRIAVVYLVYSPNQIYLQPYDVDLSTSPATVTVPSGPVLLSSPTSTNKYPHIDLFAGMNPPVMGLPSLHKYVACWEGNSYNAVVGDINSLSTPPLTLTPVAGIPDVAALTDPTGKDIACFIYSVSPSSSIYVDEWDVTGATPIPGPSTFIGTGSQQRIEAMNMYDGTSAKYQAVYTNSGIVTYNDIASANVYYPGSLHPSFPVVAAGIGNSATPPNIGNTQYTYDFFSSPDILAQDIDVTTGVPVSPPTTFLQVNYNSTATGGATEASHALSSSSNSGKGLLSCYYDGSNIYYKVTSLSSFGFKTTTINKIDTKTGFSVYPNPATDYININAPAGYGLTIMDATGKIYIQAKSTGKPLDITALAPGLYFVEAHDNNNNRQVLKFTKQ